MNKRKLLEKALTRSGNFRFSDMVALVEAFGFHLSRSAAATTVSSILVSKNWSISRTYTGKPSRTKSVSSFVSWSGTTLS